MKNLLFMRHGKQEFAIGMSDFDLPLSDKGKKAAIKKGELLSYKDIIPDVIYSSPAVRAKKTTELVAHSCGYKGEIIFNEGFYLNGSDSATRTIRALSDHINRVLFIGHNPAWTELVSNLSAPHKILPMKPATLVSLVFNGHAWRDIGPEQCHFEWVAE